MGYVRPNPLGALACALLVACHGEANAPVQGATGSIRVTVLVTGAADVAPTFEVVVGGRTTSASRDAVATIADLPPGEHHVLLRLPTNCQIGGANPRVARVVANRTTPVEFSAVCVATRGWLRVTTVTTGVDIDPNGYTLSVEGSVSGDVYYQRTVIDAVGAVTFAGVPARTVRVALTGLAVHCDLVGANPRTVSVVTGDTAVVAFEAVCVSATDRLAYVAAAPGERGDLYVINADGSGNTRLTTDRSTEAPAWSPDGSRIAFASNRDGNREIYVINADGSNAVRITNAPAADYRPAWSPDGGRIAFVSERDGNAEIYVMNADGTNPVRLTNHGNSDADPAWSPDGRRMAFTRDAGVPEVYVMDATGSEPVRISTTGGRHPAWSPDGTTLAYSTTHCPWYGYVCYPGILVKVGNQPPVELAMANGERPTWSRDGRKIAYDAVICDFYLTGCNPVGIQIARVDGTDIVGAVPVGHSPAWQP